MVSKTIRWIVMKFERHQQVQYSLDGLTLIGPRRMAPTDFGDALIFHLVTNQVVLTPLFWHAPLASNQDAQGSLWRPVTILLSCIGPTLLW